MEAVLIIIGIGLVIGAIAAGIIVLNRKRTEALEAIAQQRKLHFFQKGSDRIQPFLANLDFFSRGKYRHVRNLMMGKVTHQGHEVSVAIFDYFYTIGRHDNTDTFSQTILLFYDPSLHLPDFSLRPEHLLDKLANRFGYEDINFPDFPQFSKRYRLNSNDETSIRRLFQPNLLKFYESQQICTEASRAYVVIFPAGDLNPRATSVRIHNFQTHSESRLIAPEEINTFLETGLRLLALLSRNT